MSESNNTAFLDDTEKKDLSERFVLQPSIWNDWQKNNTSKTVFDNKKCHKCKANETEDLKFITCWLKSC